MEHPDIKEVAVCGVDDITWGQKVGAVISLEDSSSTLSLEEVKYTFNIHRYNHIKDDRRLC